MGGTSISEEKWRGRGVDVGAEVGKRDGEERREGNFGWGVNTKKK